MSLIIDGDNMKYILVVILISSLNLSYAETVQNKNVVEVDASEDFAKQSWSAGLLANAGRGLGYTVKRGLTDTWGVRLSGDYSKSNSLSGDNPSTKIPYGYEVGEISQEIHSLTAVKDLYLGEDRKYSIALGAGVAHAKNSSRVNFYKPWVIGYDRNAKVGTETKTITNNFAIGSLGFKWHDLKAFSKSYMVTFLAEFSLTDQEFAPTFKAPNGREVTLEDEDYSITQLKVEVTFPL